MAKKKLNPDRPLLYHPAPGLRARLEAMKPHTGHTTLTSMINGAVVAWLEKQEHKHKKP